MVGLVLDVSASQVFVYTAGVINWEEGRGRDVFFPLGRAVSHKVTGGSIIFILFSKPR